MKVKICIENINKEEFNEIFELDKFPEIFEEFKISDICIATNISTNGDGIISGDCYAIIIDIASSIALSLLSSYLYDKLKDLNKKLEERKRKKAVLKVNSNKIENIDEYSLKKAIKDVKE